MAARNFTLRNDDESGQWESVVSARRVRNTDNGDDALPLQAQRCMAQFQAHTDRRIVILLSAVLTVLVGWAYVWATDQDDTIRADIKASSEAMRGEINLVAENHRHVNLARIRELDTLRDRIILQLDKMDDKLDMIAVELSAHNLVDKIRFAVPDLPGDSIMDPSRSALPPSVIPTMGTGLPVYPR